MKYDWKKTDKHLYLTGAAPVTVIVPPVQFLSLSGQGDPNGEGFGRIVEALYTASYTLKMLPKKEPAPDGYVEYSVFPLEAVWMLPPKAATTDKTLFLYNAQIRQPGFLTPALAVRILELAAKKKPHLPWEGMRHILVDEGRCVQMLHTGSYDEEANTVALMDEYCHANGLRRSTNAHREIYLNDPRKTTPDKLKTLLRYQVQAV